VLPFHCSTRVWSSGPTSEKPTAVQADAEMHETAARLLPCDVLVF